MNNKMPMEQLAQQLKSWVQKNGETPAQQAAAMRKLFDSLTGALLEEAPAAEFIAAPNAVVETVCQSTGRLYRRYLELAYEENDNGIRLLGEDVSGKPVQVVFLSNTALEKMHDLQGKGPDAPQCDPETHKA